MTAGGAVASVVALALLASAQGFAAAAEPAQALVLRVQSTECATSPAFMTLVEALQVELAASGPRCCAVELRGGPPQRGALTLDVDPCDPGADEVDVRVDDGRADSPAPGSEGSAAAATGRRVSLADVAPDARPRALALAIAELVRSAPPPARPLPPAPFTAGTSPGPSGAWGKALALEAVLAAQPRLDTLLGGGRVGLSLSANRWAAALDAQVTAGSRTVDLGSVAVRLVRLTAGVGPRFPVGGAVLDVAACGGLGWAWVVGRSSRADVTAASGSGLIGTLGARAALEAPTSHRLRARVSIESGGTLRRLTAEVNGAAAAGVSGPYFLVGVGLALATLLP